MVRFLLKIYRYIEAHFLTKSEHDYASWSHPSKKSEYTGNTPEQLLRVWWSAVEEGNKCVKKRKIRRKCGSYQYRSKHLTDKYPEKSTHLNLHDSYPATVVIVGVYYKQKNPSIMVWCPNTFQRCRLYYVSYRALQILVMR